MAQRYQRKWSVLRICFFHTQSFLYGPHGALSTYDVIHLSVLGLTRSMPRSSEFMPEGEGFSSAASYSQQSVFCPESLNL